MSKNPQTTRSLPTPNCSETKHSDQDALLEVGTLCGSLKQGPPPSIYIYIYTRVSVCVCVLIHRFYIYRCAHTYVRTCIHTCRHIHTPKPKPKPQAFDPKACMSPFRNCFSTTFTDYVDTGLHDLKPWRGELSSAMLRGFRV